MSSPRSDVDFIIITALEEERDAILEKLPSYKKNSPSNDDIRTYYSAELPVVFPDGSKGIYEIMVMSLLGMGRVEATTATSDAIRRWNPRYVLLVGIAGGVAEEGVNLGDIVISDQIVDYELQKLTSEGPEVRWQVYRADPRMIGAVRNLDRNGWQGLVILERPDSGTPTRHIGPIASGDKVIASDEVLAKYRDKWPKLIGVEMEAAGVAIASFQSVKSPGFFMIRGVSDLANQQKDSNQVKKWRSYACDIAASYTIGLLKSGPIVLRIPDEIPLKVFILYDSKSYQIPMTLDYSWSWEVIFNLVIFAFANNPNKGQAIHFDNDPTAYKILDVNSKQWMSPPSTAGKLRTDKIALIRKSELKGFFPELEEDLKAKALVTLINNL